MTEQAARGAPRVSVGVPVYNGERFIGQALDSLVGQSFPDLEIVISDNASTDDTAAICAEYARRDDRIRYVRSARNVGLAKNFHRVVALSTGRYFKLANADDLCSPDLVAQCVGVLDRRPEVVLCYGKTTLIDGAGQTLRPYEDRLHLPSASVTERFRQALERVGLVNVLQGVIRAEALRRTALIDNYLGADMVLVAELALHGQFHELPERLFRRRIHDEAFSTQTSDEGQRALWEPGARRRMELYLWRHYAGYLRAIARAQLPPGTKLRLAAVVARRGITARRALARELVDGLRHRR
jgi:glycosyltransferase involved in cell wall biosynthesis